MLAARDYGGDGEPAILIHGGPGQNLATWDTFVPHLAPEIRAVALNMRGNGASDDSDDYSWPALASDIQAVGQHFGFSRPLVIGHSWGGQLATYYASQYADAGGVVAIEGWITDVRTELGDEIWEWMRAEYASEPFMKFAGTDVQLGPILAWIAHTNGADAAAVTRRQLVEGSDDLLRWRRSVDQLVHIQRTIDAAPESPAPCFSSAARGVKPRCSLHAKESWGRGRSVAPRRSPWRPGTTTFAPSGFPVATMSPTSFPSSSQD
jgi:pimeloyl-ACP methyl ester carboxylesterase